MRWHFYLIWSFEFDGKQCAHYRVEDEDSKYESRIHRADVEQTCRGNRQLRSQQFYHVSAVIIVPDQGHRSIEEWFTRPVCRIMLSSDHRVRYPWKACRVFDKALADTSPRFQQQSCDSLCLDSSVSRPCSSVSMHDQVADLGCYPFVGELA